MPAYRSASSLTTGCLAVNPDVSSWKPSWAGRPSSSQPAPGPQACPVTRVPSGRAEATAAGTTAAGTTAAGTTAAGTTAAGTTARRAVTRSVPGPSGVSEVRHTAPAASTP